jgi:hypothetical protein
MEPKASLEEMAENCVCYVCNQAFILLGKKIGTFILPVRRKKGYWQILCPRHFQTPWQRVFDSFGGWPEGQN